MKIFDSRARLGATIIAAAATMLAATAATAAPPTSGDVLYLGHGGKNNVWLTLQAVNQTTFDFMPRDFPKDPPAESGIGNFKANHRCAVADQVIYTWTGVNGDEAPEQRVAARFADCNKFGAGQRAEWTSALYDVETGVLIVRANDDQAFVLKGVVDLDPTKLAGLPAATAEDVRVTGLTANTE